MTEATTYGYKRAAMERAHAERSAVFKHLFSRLFARPERATEIAGQTA